MTYLKKMGLPGTLLVSLLSFGNVYGYYPAQSSQTPASTYQNPETPPPPSYPAYSAPQPNQGGTVTYPAYNYPPNYGYPGGYLPPAPVNPGQDDADAIYRANQHPN